jgi:predicted nucleic acid-binding protein
MKDRLFLDTNIWVYLFSDSVKSDLATKLVENHFNQIVISTQVLTELYNVLVKKKIKTNKEALQIIIELNTNFKTSSISPEMVIKAAEIANSLLFSIYDSLIISAALQNQCTLLYTEDLQHDQTINGKMRIVNPFSLKNKN